MNKTFFEIRINFKEDAFLEPIRDLLGKEGIFPNELVEESGAGYKELLFYVTYSSRARSIEKVFAGARLEGVDLAVKEIRPCDWQTKWKKDYKPLLLTPGIRIIPPAFRGEPSKENISDIYIDTDLVFGSGTHPTTQEIAGFIEKKTGLFKDFLDIGTGTGILSIVACKCGAGRIWALDKSPEAIKTTRENCRQNGCAPELLEAIDLKIFKKKELFDFVAANLLTHDLIELRDKIVSYVRHGKYLAVSGISTCNYGLFRSKFNENGLKCLQIKKQREWCAILYKKLIAEKEGA